MATLIASSADLAGDAGVIARAAAVSAAVAAASDEIEASRRLPPALLERLHEAELFRQIDVRLAKIAAVEDVDLAARRSHGISLRECLAWMRLAAIVRVVAAARHPGPIGRDYGSGAPGR